MIKHRTAAALAITGVTGSGQAGRRFPLTWSEVEIQAIRKTRTASVVAAAFLAGVVGTQAVFMFWPGSAAAHQQGRKLHLADAPPDQQVKTITYCDGIYRVTTKEGSPIEYREFDLRFKTDASPDGPPPGAPVVINAGMRGDRGFVIFSAPGEISAIIKAEC